MEVFHLKCSELIFCVLITNSTPLFSMLPTFTNWVVKPELPGTGTSYNRWSVLRSYTSISPEILLFRKPYSSPASTWFDFSHCRLLLPNCVGARPEEPAYFTPLQSDCEA